MNTKSTTDRTSAATRADRRQWRRMERRAIKDHDADQLATLRGLAETGNAVTAMRAADSEEWLTDSVEMFIAGRRLRAGRVYRPALAVLREALGGIASVPLTAVGRYGPYWVLTFKVATEPLVMLVDRLILLPEWGGTSALFGPVPAPASQLA